MERNLIHTDTSPSHKFCKLLCSPDWSRASKGGILERVWRHFIIGRALFRTTHVSSFAMQIQENQCAVARNHPASFVVRQHFRHSSGVSVQAEEFTLPTARPWNRSSFVKTGIQRIPWTRWTMNIFWRACTLFLQVNPASLWTLVAAYHIRAQQSVVQIDTPSCGGRHVLGSHQCFTFEESEIQEILEATVRYRNSGCRHDTKHGRWQRLWVHASRARNGSRWTERARHITHHYFMLSTGRSTRK